jgi:hypothetical protein
MAPPERSLGVAATARNPNDVGLEDVACLDPYHSQVQTTEAGSSIGGKEALSAGSEYSRCSSARRNPARLISGRHPLRKRSNPRLDLPSIFGQLSVSASRVHISH